MNVSLAKLWRPRTRRLQVCETLVLGNKGFVSVVGYEDQRFLVGGTASSIALLAELDREGDSTSDRSRHRNVEAADLDEAPRISGFQTMQQKATE